MPTDLKRWNGTQWVRLFGDLRGPLVIDGEEVATNKPPAWVNLTLLAPWLNYSVPAYQPAQYRVDRGTVELRGLIKLSAAITASSAVASGLPNPPTGNNIMITLQYPGPTGWHSPARFDITPAGSLIYGWVAGQTSPSWVSLNGIRWSGA